MLAQEIAHRDFELIEDSLMGLANDSQELSPLLAALARVQEDVAIETQDVLSQAEEALVMG